MGIEPLALDTAYRLTAIVIGLSVTIAAVEYVLIRTDLREDGFFRWSVLRTEYRWTSTGVTAPVWDVTAAHLHTVLAIKAMSGVGIIVAGATGADDRMLWVTLLATQLAACISLNVRTLYGLDGSDQMTILVLVGLLIGRAAPDGHDVAWVAAAFIAGQSLLAYTAAGVAKAVSPEWWSGKALTGVLGTKMYGHPGAARIAARWPRVVIALSAFLIIAECGIVLAVVASPTTAVIALAAGAAFHIGCMVLMGLNTFIWAFAATYPMVLATVARIDLLGQL